MGFSINGILLLMLLTLTQHRPLDGTRHMGLISSVIDMHYRDVTGDCRHVLIAVAVVVEPPCHIFFDHFCRQIRLWFPSIPVSIVTLPVDEVLTCDIRAKANRMDLKLHFTVLITGTGPCYAYVHRVNTGTV